MQKALRSQKFYVLQKNAAPRVKTGFAFSYYEYRILAKAAGGRGGRGAAGPTTPSELPCSSNVL